jgi:hypothetical protein
MVSVVSGQSAIGESKLFHQHFVESHRSESQPKKPKEIASISLQDESERKLSIGCSPLLCFSVGFL